MNDIELPEQDLDRRSLIKRAAVVGATTVWVAPTVQSLTSSAMAVGTPRGQCTACITGGGNQILGGTWNGSPLEKITVGVGQICCMPNGAPANQQEVNIVLHPVVGKTKEFMFRYNLTVTCTKTGDPSPPPQTEDCANRLTGTLQDADGNTLSFIFEDNGEPGKNVDFVSIQISGPAGNAFGAGFLAKGNLQIHDGLGPIERDCSGC